jgi:NAD(P)-dependent dehydrogenase (short-subunit alcohol dehydrogenase family)
MEISGAVVVVTGGAHGIGAALARRFAAEGARQVVVADLDGRGAISVADEIGGDAVELDVTDRDATRHLVGTLEERWGGVDLFCANAGIASAEGIDMSDEMWDRTWRVNTMSHVYAAQAVLPGMLARGGGYFLATVSAAGLLTNIGAAAYSVTKHAALAHAEWLAVTYGDQGLKVSALCPQFVDTDMITSFSTLDMDDSFIRSVAITADEVAIATVEGIRAERFLILPHPEVAGFFQAKATDYDRWLAGMRRLQRQWLPNPPAPPA